jgi:hypothetical protein
MRVFWRTVLVLAVIVGVGLLTAHGVLAHAHARGDAGPEVRLTAWMAGLFAGGAGGVVTLVATLWKRSG